MSCYFEKQLCKLFSLKLLRVIIPTLQLYSSNGLIYIMHYKTFQVELFVLIFEVVFKF